MSNWTHAQAGDQPAALLAELKLAATDSQKVSLLVRLSYQYRAALQAPIARQYSDEAMAIGLRSPQRTLLAKALTEQGSNVSTLTGGPTTAIQCLEDALLLVSNVPAGTIATIRQRYADAQTPRSRSIVSPFKEAGDLLTPLSGDSDNVRLNIHAAMFEIYMQEGERIKARYHVEEMARFAARAQKPLDEAWAIGQLSAISYALGDLKTAYHALLREREVGKRASLPQVEADALFNLAALYSNMGDFPKSVDCHQQAIQLFRSQGNARALASTQSNLGEVYAAHGDYSKAIQLYQLAIAGCTTENDDNIRAAAIHNIGDALFHQGKTAEALANYHTARLLNKRAGNDKFLVQNQLGLAGLHLSEKNYDSASYYYALAEKLATKNSFAAEVANARYGIGKLKLASALSATDVQSKQDLLHAATSAFAAAEDIARSSGLTTLLQEIFAARSDAEKAAGNYKASMEYFQKATSIKDSIFSQQNAFKIARLESEAALAQKDTLLHTKETEAARLRRRQLYMLLIGAGTLLLGGIGFMLYRAHDRRNKQLQQAEMEKRIAEVEMQALRAQMNPHFIFNALSSINHHIAQNDAVTATNHLSKFAKLIRMILDSSVSKTVSLSQEAELLKLYLQMEAIRFGEGIDWKITIDPALDKEAVRLPSMIVQPYVENAIWHGLLNRPEGGKLRIHFSKADRDLLVIVEDDGIGRERSAELKRGNAMGKQSHGMNITAERLRMSNIAHNTGSSVNITDLKDEYGNPAGTRVSINIENALAV